MIPVTPFDPDESTDRSDLVAGALVAAVLVSVSLGVLVGGGAGVAVAGNNTTEIEDKAPYYDNQSTVTAKPWLSGNTDPTLPNVLDLMVKFVSFVIGAGSAQGGGSASQLVIGLMVVGVGLGATSNSTTGSVGGPVIATALSFALVRAGLAPQWLYAVMLFGVGLIGATAYYRLQQ